VSVWLLRGRSAERFDGIRRFGRPPSVVPPAWALTARIWDAIGAERAAVERADGDDRFGRLRAAIPPATRSLVLVIPDGTRVGAWQEVLPDLIRAVDASLPKAARRTLLVAGGVHAPHAVTELAAHLSRSGVVRESLEGWAVTQNGDNAFRDHVPVGTTPAGTAVALHPAYVEAGFRIILGEISWHYFAGFGGGRKLVFPGLAEPRGILANHRRAVVVRRPAGDQGHAALDAVSWQEACGPGLLEGNPVHEDLDAAVRLAPPHWVVTALDDSPADPDPASPALFPPRVVQGPYPASFDEASACFEGRHRIAATVHPAALVVDAGGRPRDRSFLQAHKSLQHGARFVAPGGRLLVIAACEDGLGSETLRRYAADPGGFRPESEGTAEDGVDAGTLLHLQTLVALRRATAAVEIGLSSDLPAETVRALGMTPLPGWEEAWAWLAAKGAGTWGWLPRAELFLPVREQRGGALR